MKRVLDRILYCVVWGFGTVLGWMPRVIHLLLADLLYLLLYRIFRYRVKVTKRNLELSFPEKSVKERKRIERRFYLYLMDVFIETLSLIGLSKERISQKMKFYDSEKFDKECAKGSVIVAMAHYASWEWPISYAYRTKSKLMPVYHTLQSEWADKLFYNMRSRFGAKPISMRAVGRKMVEMKDEKIILALIADQTPPIIEKSEWVTFLNQDTIFFSGIETFSKRYNMPVFFFDIDCTKRGHYEGRFVQLYDGKEDVQQYEITRRYIRFLEQKIVSKPELWMWSHKRWKHKKI